MALRLVEKREQNIILEMVNDYANKLAYGLQIIVTDSFLTYKGVAVEIARIFNKDIIHVRHIHQPPYGRIEIGYYKPNPKGIDVTTLKATNEITAVNGYFLRRMSQKHLNGLEKQKRGRKAGGKNRSKEEIEAEKR
jgi:hypothetical protein